MSDTSAAGGDEGAIALPGARAVMRWTPVMSSFVLRKFVNLVGQGVKTDKGLKEVHLNSVARALSEFTGQDVTGTQVYNHLRKWRKRWVKVCRLKGLSGANWDENTYTIILDEKHLMRHTKDHPKDSEFLNVPIENYVQMQIIFGAGQATGRFAIGSNEPLGTVPDFTESTMTSEGFASGTVSLGSAPVAASAPPAASVPLAASGASQGTKTNEEAGNSGKRKRSMIDEELCIMTGLADAVGKVAEAIQAPVVVRNTEVHPELYSICMGTPGFTDEELMTAFTFLLDNKRQGEGFVTMTEPHRVLWLRQFLARLRRQGLLVDD